MREGKRSVREGLRNRIGTSFGEISYRGMKKESS